MIDAKLYRNLNKYDFKYWNITGSNDQCLLYTVSPHKLRGCWTESHHFSTQCR